MARIFDRLSGLNSQGLAFKKLLDKNFTTVESLFTQMIRAVSSIDDIATVRITADYTGAVDPSSQLPMTIQPVRRYDGTDVSSTSTWSLAQETGAVTASIGASTGEITITAAVGSDNLTITSTYLGVALTKLVPVTFTLAAPPTASGGGSGSATSTATDTSFSSFNSTTHAAVSDELTVMVGASGNVSLSAPLSVTTAAASPDGTFDVKLLWRWWNGAAWADVGTESSSNPDCVVIRSGRNMAKGSVTENKTKTGLAVASSQKFQLYARNNSGTRTMSLSGTASAVSS